MDAAEFFLERLQQLGYVVLARGGHTFALLRCHRKKACASPGTTGGPIGCNLVYVRFPNLLLQKAREGFRKEPRVSHRMRWCYTRKVPTTRPRYTFTDTGELEALLDAAQRRWPEVSNRKALLLRLAEEGGSAVGLDDERLDVEERRKRVQAALKRLRSLVDAELLLSDRAWR
jgi:hypothetical protein